MKHIEGSANLTANAPYRIGINNVVCFQSGIYYSKMAEEQQLDKDICELLQSTTSTTFCPNQYALPDKPSVLL